MTKNIIEKELLELREYSEKNEEKQKSFGVIKNSE